VTDAECEKRRWHLGINNSLGQIQNRYKAVSELGWFSGPEMAKETMRTKNTRGGLAEWLK
jgi:hypothetical protein